MCYGSIILGGMCIMFLFGSIDFWIVNSFVFDMFVLRFEFALIVKGVSYYVWTYLFKDIDMDVFVEVCVIIVG